MPRGPRQKSCESIYHVMSKSISEADLFRCDDDMDYYLGRLKHYIDKYHCRIYAFILMTNHVHLFIDPCGYDISLFMRCLNNSYVSYYNRKYGRCGPLFHGRFASKIVDNDAYSLTLSAYIHNNAKDLPGYNGKEETYRYSSYGIYTGYRKDIEGIVDTNFLLSQFNKELNTSRIKYKVFAEIMKDTGIVKNADDSIMRSYTENVYRSEKKHIVRERVPGDLVKKISEILSERHPEDLRAKYNREASEFRAFTTYILRVLSGYTYRIICEYIGNMSMSGISRLSKEGFHLLSSQERYRSAFNAIIQAA